MWFFGGWSALKTQQTCRLCAWPSVLEPQCEVISDVRMSAVYWFVGQNCLKVHVRHQQINSWLMFLSAVNALFVPLLGQYFAMWQAKADAVRWLNICICACACAWKHAYVHLHVHVHVRVHGCRSGLLVRFARRSRTAQSSLQHQQDNHAANKIRLALCCWAWGRYVQWRCWLAGQRYCASDEGASVYDAIEFSACFC